MFSAGRALFLEFFSICRLIKGLQDIPESKNLLTLCLVAYGLCSTILVHLSEPLDKAILAAILGLLLVCWLTYLLVNRRWGSERN